MDEIKAWLGAAVVLIFGAGFGQAYIRKFISNSLEMAKDRAEGDIITHQAIRIKELEAQNAEITDKYVQAMKSLGEVLGEVKALTMKSNALEAEVHSLRGIVETMQKQINELMSR